MSLSFIAIPVLLDTTMDAPLLFSQWRRMYHYGHQTMPVLAVGTFLLYAFTCVNRCWGRRKPWGVFALAAVTTVSIIPFTWICMANTNNELFRLEAASKTQPLVMGVVDGRELLKTWSRLHFMRSLLPLSGAVLGTLGIF